MEYINSKKDNKANDHINKLYEVENIITRKIENSNRLYLIKWKGYPLRYCSWEPLSHLENILDMVNDFENNFPNSIKQKSLKRFLNLYNKKLEKKKVFKEKKFLKRKTKKNSCINNKLPSYLNLDYNINNENYNINEKPKKEDNNGNDFNFENLKQNKDDEIEKGKNYKNNDYNFMDLYIGEETKDIDSKNHIKIFLNDKINEEEKEIELMNNGTNKDKLENNFNSTNNTEKLIKPILVW